MNTQKLRLLSSVRLSLTLVVLALAVIAAVFQSNTATTQSNKTTSYDLNTLAGKVAALNDATGRRIHFSGAVERAADEEEQSLLFAADGPILADLSEGLSVLPPAVTVNQDTAGAPQNEPAIAVDPNNPNRLVVGANDYVTATWTCTTIFGFPCSLFGDTTLGGYYSNDGGQTWCCVSSSPDHLGTLVPGVNRLAGGDYGRASDPALAFDSRGNVYVSGIAFLKGFETDNTVVVSRGSFDSSGALTWGALTLINATKSNAIFNDKSWIAADANSNSPYRDRVYVSWTRFTFGGVVQSPIAFAFSADGGRTFSPSRLIADNVVNSQGSRAVIGSDGTVYVFFWGFLPSELSSTLGHIWMVKSVDGGVKFSKPTRIADTRDLPLLSDAVFRTGGGAYPAATVARNGDLYVTWATQLSDAGGLCPAPTNNGCHSAVVYSRSTDGGAHWSSPALAFPDLDASVRTPVGYPAPDGLPTPAPRRVDTIYSDVAVAPNGAVYISAYAADIVSPWQTCRLFRDGGLVCDSPGPYIHNAKLNYYVRNVSAGTTTLASTQAINTRYQFGGRFIGDYTGLAVGPDGWAHAVWTDTNNAQYFVWAGPFYFDPPILANQQDIVIRSLF